MKIAVVVAVDVALGEDVVVEGSIETWPIMKMVAGMDTLIVTSQPRMVKRQLKGVVMVVLLVALSVVLVVVASAMGKPKKGKGPEEYSNAAVELDVG